MLDLLFVYGTLDPNAGWLDENKIMYETIGLGTIWGERIKDGEYPAVIKGAANQRIVIGRILKLLFPKDAFQVLDEYEEFYPEDITKSLYVREITKVEHGSKIFDCWIYWYNGVINYENKVKDKLLK